jgi:chemotaxis signal transduction protein/nucleoid-associated protein YgaU
MSNLLLINVAGARYGLWEAALASVRVALPLHLLPLSPPAIAGIAILDDRSAVIADLAASLGSAPVSNAQNATFLIIDPKEKIAGFVIEGAVDRVEHPAEQAIPVPDAVSTQEIDTCVVINDVAVPIINIRALQERLQQGSLELPQAAGGFGAAQHSDPSSFAVRAFLIDGERFCVNAEGAAFAAIGRERISVLPARNNWLAGITVHDHAVLPLVRLDDLLGIEARSDRGGMLIAGSGGGRHGLLVDEDLGIIEQQDLRISGLPALARRSWMPAAAVSTGMVYPLIEAGRIVSARAGEDERDALPSFIPGSEFPQKFRKGEVEVVEFSLLGATHAVPKDEVKEVHPVLPISRIPHATGIVMGVADLNGELLPVLDLAAIFGRRSAVNRKWRLIRIANGDFQALIVTEEVVGDRRLSLANQKQLPLALPHQVLYGCYLDEGMVRLIMNVQSLAVHFEKAAVRELVTGLSPETAIRVQQHIPAAPRPTEDTLSEAAASESRTIPGHAPVPTRNAPAKPQAAEQVESSEEARISHQRSRLAEDESRRQAAAKAGEEALQREEAERRRKENDARLCAEEQARLQTEEEARHKAADEQRMREEKTRVQAEEHARARIEEETREQEREAARRTAAGEARKREREEAERQTAEQVPVAEAPIREELPGERKKGKRRTIAAVLAAALVLAIYFVSVPRKLSEPPAGKNEMPAAARKPSPPPVEPEKETPKTVQKNLNVPAPETLPPLYLTVPPDRVVLPEQEIYRVVKGDTLWGIAERFTGNPRNYPRVARDNSIATPDLIFPGQRIRLVQERH